MRHTCPAGEDVRTILRDARTALSVDPFIVTHPLPVCEDAVASRAEVPDVWEHPVEPNVTTRWFVSIALVAAAACSRADRPADAGARASVDLTGAGATFPYPIYARWFADYDSLTGVRINYQSIGSGGGVRTITERTVDFGATDGPMTDDELRRAGGDVLHFPTVVGAVVVTYNLPGIQDTLRFDGHVLANIFLGRITRWNDARIAALNPDVALPEAELLVVHRTDGSGTTYVMTDYLTAVSAEWASGPGRGKAVRWPVGLGGKGNEGVAGLIRQTPYAIGYVELVYAQQNGLPIAAIENPTGAFVTPTIASITAAAEAATAAFGPASDYRVSIVNAPGEGAYPIASLTWLLVYREQPDTVKGRQLVEFMRWMYSAGQATAPSLGYAPLPAALAGRLTARLDSIRLGASP